MRNKFISLFSLLVLCSVFGCKGSSYSLHASPSKMPQTRTKQTYHWQKMNAKGVDWKKVKASYWKKQLSPLAFRVCRQAGTERPFTGKHLHNKKKGLFVCSSCGHVLFDAKTKFRSGTGWPSFYDVYNKKSVKLHTDTSYGMTRTEVVCGRCKAHLGHVFKDGPKPTGLRYCMNSVCLDHIPTKK